MVILNVLDSLERGKRERPTRSHPRTFVICPSSLIHVRKVPFPIAGRCAKLSLQCLWATRKGCCTRTRSTLIWLTLGTKHR